MGDWGEDDRWLREHSDGSVPTIATLKYLLRQVEWVTEPTSDGTYEFCPVCRARDLGTKRRHKRGCKLEAAIR